MVSYNAVITAFEEGCLWQMAGQMLLEIEEQNSHGDVACPLLGVGWGGEAFYLGLGDTLLPN